MPSNVNVADDVPTKPAVTVTTTLRSVAVPVRGRHAMLLPDVHAAVAHVASETCSVDVGSLEWKFSPPTVMLSDVEIARFALSPSLTTGAALHTKLIWGCKVVIVFIVRIVGAAYRANTVEGECGIPRANKPAHRHLGRH